MLKVSIITVCYNSAQTIECTLDSVANQTYANKEHIIIDGASKDSTLDIIKRHKHSSNTLVSERDNGIYDAMNKGISLATGDIVGTLNADDFYSDNLVLSEVEKVFMDPTIEACYGDLIYVKEDNIYKTVRYWKSKKYEPALFKSGWMPAHPTFFVRKSVYERLGAFSLDYKIAADFELLFRFIEKNKIKTKYIPKVLVKMRLGGTTNKNISNVITQNKEMIKTLKEYYGDFSLIGFILRKLANRTLQFIKHPKS